MLPDEIWSIGQVKREKYLDVYMDQDLQNSTILCQVTGTAHEASYCGLMIDPSTLKDWSPHRGRCSLLFRSL